MKIGIIGLGSIGKRHAINATNLGHDVYTFDPFVKGDSRFRREGDLLDWCDAAVISSPTLCHEASLHACIERGKHALVEKPLATLISPRLPELLRTADEKNLVIMMGNNLRFHPGVEYAKKWLGLRTPTWANFICATPPIHNAHEGVILSTGAHEVDVAIHLFGPVQYVAGASARYLSRGSTSVEDVADFTLVHVGKMRSTFHLDFSTAHRIRQFWIATEDGNLEIDLDERTYFDPQKETDDGAYFGGSYDDDYVAEMREFTRQIEGDFGVNVGATGHDGLETLSVLLNVRAKAAFH
jgi:predicted dehydrogenase